MAKKNVYTDKIPLFPQKPWTYQVRGFFCVKAVIREYFDKDRSLTQDNDLLKYFTTYNKNIQAILRDLTGESGCQF